VVDGAPSLSLSNQPTRLILWDVDGTLVFAGGVAGKAFSTAVASVLGKDPGEHGVSMSGKTDPQIALEILGTLALSSDEAERELPMVLAELERELEAAEQIVRETGHVHPGVRELLSRLHQMPGVIQSVLTGNLAANAKLKVAAFGLDRWLDLEIGAFGSDNADRSELVQIALQRARAVRGLTVDPEDSWVVGDTPLDLACARAGGSRCLLVGTGRYPLEELEGLSADVVLPDLADTDRVLRVLLA
jgi:phosphoglycolate phosphatase